jgi:hypothetical protein
LVIERDNTSDYLLNPLHRFGASKARFFTHFGFRSTGLASIWWTALG